MIKKIKIIQYPNISVARFDTTVVGTGLDNGTRVKHEVYPDDEMENCYWHEITYLTRDEKPTQTYNRSVSKRLFWGKVRLARLRICCKEETWIAIAQAIYGLKNSRKPIK